MTRNLAAFAAITLLFTARDAAASDLDLGDIFHFHGYGTLGLTHSSDDQADYVNSWITQPKGAGYTNEWSPYVDSKLALQLDANITSRLSAVVQIISQNDNNNSWNGKPNPPYRPSVEWANVKYNVTDNLSIRLGRIVLPFNMISEYRNVGYAIPFVRAPIEVYGVIPFTTSDGMDVTWKQHFGNYINSVVVHGGVNSLRSENTGAAQSQMYGINDTFETGSLTVRAAYMYSPVKAPTGITLFNTFSEAADSLPDGAGAAAAAEAQLYDHLYNLGHWSSIEHYDIGMTYDTGSWFVMAEGVKHVTDNIFGTVTSGFAAAGYRYKKLTPYVSFARVKTQYGEHPPISLDGLPAGLIVLGSIANGIVTGITATPRSQQTISAGLRWDFASSFDLKAQYDFVDVDAGSDGYFTNVQPGFRPGANVSVFSATVDFVF
jgi:hypothetical protein